MSSYSEIAANAITDYQRTHGKWPTTGQLVAFTREPASVIRAGLSELVALRTHRESKRGSGRYVWKPRKLRE